MSATSRDKAHAAGAHTRRAFLALGGGLAGVAGVAALSPAVRASELARVSELTQAAELVPRLELLRAMGIMPGLESATYTQTYPQLAGAGGIAASVRAAPRPRVYLRHEWSALLPKLRAEVVDHAPELIVIHHTASPNGGDLSHDAAFALSRAIQRHHMRHNQWDDIGEHFTIGRGGQIMEGRNRTMPAIALGDHAVGAHTANHNRGTMGIETAGTFMTALPTNQQVAALTRLTAWICAVYGLDPNVAIVAHRDLNSTSCPGDRLYEYLPELRARVARRLGYGATRGRAIRLGPPSVATGAAGGALGSGALARGLPGPTARFDHGPAVGPHDTLR